jgi:hypothetical protein
MARALKAAGFVVDLAATVTMHGSKGPRDYDVAVLDLGFHASMVSLVLRRWAPTIDPFR